MRFIYISRVNFYNMQKFFKSVLLHLNPMKMAYVHTYTIPCLLYTYL